MKSFWTNKHKKTVKNKEKYSANAPAPHPSPAKAAPEAPTSAAQLTIGYFPKILFRLYDRTASASNDNEVRNWADVILLEGGKLVVEESSVLYSSHSIGHNTGRNTLRKNVTFEQLPELIRQSTDKKAAKYVGMTQQNWQSYVQEQPVEAASPEYPTMQFGGFEWYILDKLNDGSLLLLCKHGVSSGPWHAVKECVAWEQSTLYEWLNTAFVAHLSTAEQQALAPMDEHTKVTLPDEALLEKYLPNKEARCAKPTVEAQKNGAWTYSYSATKPDAAKYVGNGLIWTKGHYKGSDPSFKTWIICVSWDGGSCMYSCEYQNPLVRPVIRVRA